MSSRAGLVIVTLLASAPRADAEPRVAVRASGTCPSADAITRALPGRVSVIAEPAPLVLAIEEIEGGAIVRITSSTGASEARLEGRDCGVLASAVAAIVDAWFVELAAPVPIAAPSPRPIEAPAPGRRDASPPRWSLAAARALVVDPDGGARSAATELELGWWPMRRVRLRARFALGDEAALASVAGDVRRRAVSALLAAGPRLAVGRLWLEGAAGAAVVISRVDGLSPMSSGQVMRAHGAIGGSFGAGVRLAAGASLRVEAGALVYPVRDRYTLQMTTVARSPRAELGAGVGLEIAFGGRSW